MLMPRSSSAGITKLRSTFPGWLGCRIGRPAAISFAMVVFLINADCSPVFPFEHDAPLRADLNCILVAAVSLQLVKPEAGQVHILGPGGLVEHVEDRLYPVSRLRVDTLGPAPLPERLEHFALERPDHLNRPRCCNVKRYR